MLEDVLETKNAWIVFSRKNLKLHIAVPSFIPRMLQAAFRSGNIQKIQIGSFPLQSLVFSWTSRRLKILSILGFNDSRWQWVILLAGTYGSPTAFGSGFSEAEVVSALSW